MDLPGTASARPIYKQVLGSKMAQGCAFAIVRWPIVLLPFVGRG